MERSLPMNALIWQAEAFGPSSRRARPSAPQRGRSAAAVRACACSRSRRPLYLLLGVRNRCTVADSPKLV